jgi:hypothetical protein
MTGRGLDDEDPVVLIAAMLSFVVPGLGHLIMRVWLRGAIWMAGWVVVSAAGGWNLHPFVVALLVISGLDALLYRRTLRDAAE